jgi:folate-binding protein YgfZ
MALLLPLHAAHERLGARFGEADGHLVPLDYGSPAAEHEAVRERAAVIDRSHRGSIEATGRDRATFFHAILSGDVKALATGQGCEAAFLDVHGKITALLVVHCLADRLVLEMDHALVAPTLAAVDRYLISERVALEETSTRAALLTVAGPAARKVVEAAAGAPLPDLALWQHVTLGWPDVAVRAVRTSESGEEGYDLWVPVDGAERVWERVLGAGARPAGREAWNVLRVEAGVVWHGVDVDATTLILEAPLDRAYSLGKGCYLGQEVVARITYRGHVNRKIVGFRFPDARVPRAGARIRVDGHEVGRITSPVVSPSLGCGIALGFLRREHWEPGTPVEVEGDGAPLTAEVAALPLYRRPAASA